MDGCDNLAADSRQKAKRRTARCASRPTQFAGLLFQLKAGSPAGLKLPEDKRQDNLGGDRPAVESGRHEPPFPYGGLDLIGQRGDFTEKSYLPRLSRRAQGDFRYDSYYSLFSFP